MTIDLRYGDTIEQMKLIPNKSIDFICCDLKGEKLLLNNKIYEVESVIDDTDDDEFEQGLSYSKVWLSLYGC
jgi:hypothetical protein